MEKAFDKQDLHRFFNNIKSKYVIPLPITNIDGKVTCRNGMEYIEKPYNNRTEAKKDETKQESRLARQRRYVGCGHNSSVTNAYRTLGDIVLDPKRLTLDSFDAQIAERDQQELAIAHVTKWKNLTKVLPVIRMTGTNQESKRGTYDDLIGDETGTGNPRKTRRRRDTFVVQNQDWPKIKSTGFEQLSAAVEKTNKRVAATKGSTQYFQILDSDLETSIDELSETRLIDENIKEPSAIDSMKKERVTTRLEAFIYVLNALFNIKNRDLKKVEIPPRHRRTSINREKDRDQSAYNLTEERICQRDRTLPELTSNKGFTWNEGIPPWQKIKQENEFMAASVENENAERDQKSPEALDQELLLNLRKDFVAMQDKLDSHLNIRLRRLFRDEGVKFVRRFHALKHAPTLSLGMVDVRKVDRSSRVVDLDNIKTSSKQDWYVDALNELDVKRYKDDAKMTSLLKQFERYSHTDLTDEIKSLKAKLCYLTLSMPVYFVLQPDYQYAIRFVIQKGLGVHEDFFNSWFKMRFKKGRLTAQT